MPSFITPALVIRRADYSDYDRMITLFSPEHGKIDAIARGCRRPKSRLMNSVEPFTTGEFQLYASHQRYTLEQCQISDNYYELRTDYGRLCHGVYWLKLLDYSIMPEVPAADLFITTLHALAHLNYSDLPPELVTLAYELHFMRLNGLSPRMDSCVCCGKPVDEDAHFDTDLGGVVCKKCRSGGPIISNGARRIIMKLPRTYYDKFCLVYDRPEWPEAASIFRDYMNRRFHLERFAPPLYSP